MAGNAKSRKPRSAGAGNANSQRAGGARKAAARPASSGVPVWLVVVVLALLVAEGVYMTARSASQSNDLSSQVASLQARMQRVQGQQMALASDYLERASTYAAQENYGLKDDATAAARHLVGLASVLAEGHVDADALRAILKEVEMAQSARGAETPTQLQDLATRLRAMAGPAGDAGAAPKE